MSTITIAAQDVQVGDRIFDNTSFNKKDPWARVKSVQRIPAGIEIRVLGWATILHPREGIAVQRGDVVEEG